MSNENENHICPDCGGNMKESYNINMGLEWYCPNPECKEKMVEKWFEEKKKNIITELKTDPEKIMKEFNIPRKYWNATFDNFDGGDKYKTSLLRYVENPIDSLYLYGKCGCGKTHLAVAILRELFLASKKNFSSCAFKSVPELLCEIRNSFLGNGEETEKKIIDRHVLPRFLVLDDLGAEKSSEFSIATMYLIINRRQVDLKPTIITSNLTIDQIESQVDARLASRLAEYKYFFVNLPDYRKAKKA